MKPTILAHDLGTTGNKATLYDDEGRLIGSAFSPYEVSYPQRNWAEQNAEDWWRAVCRSTRQLLAETNISGAQVAAISFSGQMMGAVPVDAQGRPLRPAIIWADQRATEQVERLSQRVDPQRVYQLTGHRLAASYSLHKIAWIRDHQPQIYAEAHAFLHAKDAMIARLTGEFVTEPSDASGMNCYDLARGQWAEDILEAAQIDISKLPRIVASTDVVGHVLPSVAEELGLPAGVPVVAGGGDGACASVGAGSVRPDVVYSYVGSSSWIATTTTQPIFDPDQRTFTFGHVLPDMFMPCGTMQTAGSSYQWTRDQLGGLEQQAAQLVGMSGYELMNALAEATTPGANGLIFLPYLLGERSPRWNPNARAAFIGLTMRHTRAEMFRAVLEGVALNLAIILQAFLRQGARADAVRVIGGGVSSRLWVQIMADVYGAPLHRLAVLEEATSMGAAVVGGVGVGLYPDFSMAERMNPIAETISPNSAHHDLYRRRLLAFEAAYQALAPVFDLL